MQFTDTKDFIASKKYSETYTCVTSKTFYQGNYGRTFTYIREIIETSRT